MFLPCFVVRQIAMFSDEDVAPQLGMKAFQTSDPWLVILFATWQALGNIKPTRVREFCCERDAYLFLRGHVVKDHGSYGAVVKGKMLESNPIIISFTLRESGTKCVLQGS